MAYQHIVVATDLSEDAEFLLGKGARLAAALQAKLSLIYIDIHRAGYYVDLGVGDYNYTDRTFSERVKNMLNAIKGQSSYPVEEVIVSRGALTEELNRVAKEKGFDLVIFGHHHDVWSRLVSSARQAINELNVDLLVIPIEKNSRGRRRAAAFHSHRLSLSGHNRLSAIIPLADNPPGK